MDRGEPPVGRYREDCFPIGAATVWPGFKAANENENYAAAAEKLREVIASTVIPRLVKSLRSSTAPAGPKAAHVDTLLSLSLSADHVAAAGQLCTLRTAGMPTHVLMDGLLAPVARRLGDLWTTDELDFVAVTIAAGKLAVGVRRLDALSNIVAGPGAPCAMFTTLETEDHRLGALSAAAAFREAGWRTREAHAAPPERAAELVRGDDFDLIGLSIADARHSRDAARMVAALRKASRNRRAMVVVGGAACGDEPDFAARIGADFAARDCAGAIATANDALPSRRQRAGRA